MSTSGSRVNASMLCLVATAVYAAALLTHHLQLIFEPLPLDMYEPTMHIITELIAGGGNPYAYGDLPVYANIYPPLYNLVAVPLTWIFDNGLQLHRALSAACIIGSCILIFQSLRKLELSTGYAAAGAALFYAALLHYNTPTASVNAIGQLLFTACLLLPLLHDFNGRSLALSAVCGVLTLFAKQYFVLAPAIVCCYLLLNMQLRAAVIYGLQVGTGLLMCQGLILMLAPYYLDLTFFGMRAATSFAAGESQLATQLLGFSKIYAGLLLALLAGVTKLVRERAWSRRTIYPLLALLCATLAVILFLGHNRGNYLTYLFQLMTPLLILASLGSLAGSRYRDEILLPALLYSFLMSWLLLPTHEVEQRQGWEDIRELISSSDNPYADGMLAHIILEQGKPLHQGPLTRWFYYARFKPQGLLRKEPATRIEHITDGYIARVNDAIATKSFDLVLLRPGRWDIIGAPRQGWPFAQGDNQAAFKANYALERTVVLSYPERRGGGKRAVEIWRPR